MTGRRGSLMYEAASDGEDEEHDSEVDIREESEEASSTPVKAQVQVPTLQPAPRVKKEVTPVVTAPVVQSKSSSASSTKTVVSPAGVVDALLPEEGVVVDGSTFIVLANLRASQPGDLSISEGEILKIVQTRPDGWWMARNSSGVIGLVPKTYLRHALPMDEQRKAKEESKETTPPTRQARCLGDAQLLDPHLSFACHLTPRLSHSNIGFHDLYWNYRDDKLRKRRVRVSKLVRLVRLEGMPKQDGEVCLVRAALYDRSRRTGRQIVSNVHTIRAQVKNRTWTFNTRMFLDSLLFRVLSIKMWDSLLRFIITDGYNVFWG
uniref:SH3 domain-containing protein n=1 Tax=Angiostrongylus cantonensis TaxID=6313 RepID=A0A0K0DR86_ANGCA